MKLQKLLDYLGISTDAANGSYRETVEGITWSPETSNQNSEQITYLDDGYLVPQRSLHFKTPQALSTRDVASTNDDIETITLPIEVDVVVVSQTPELNNTVSETSRDSETLEIQTSAVIQEMTPILLISDVTKTKKPSKIKKLKRAVRHVLRRTKVSPVTVCNEKTEMAPVDGALKRLRERNAKFYE